LVLSSEPTGLLIPVQEPEQKRQLPLEDERAVKKQKTDDLSYEEQIKSNERVLHTHLSILQTKNNKVFRNRFEILVDEPI
jgi:hypothetical protein